MPFQTVATHANTWIVVNTEIVMLPAEKKLIAISDMPTVNMWCSQTPKPTTPVRIVAIATNGISDNGPPREDGNDQRDHPGRRQKDDVDPRVPEEPEELLPQEGAAAARDTEEMRAPSSIKLEKDAGRGKCRQRKEDDERDRQRAVEKQRHAADRHAGRAQAQEWSR